MRGLTIDFALQRVYELESKRDVELNRKMIDNYIKSLRAGFDKNRQKFLDMNKMTIEDLRKVHAEKRFVEYGDKTSLKQFEISGHDQMLARILDAPMKSAIQNDNKELQSKLKLIKDQLRGSGSSERAAPLKQIRSSARTANDVMREVMAENAKAQTQKAATQKQSRSDEQEEQINTNSQPRNLIESMQEHINRMQDAAFFDEESALQKQKNPFKKP